MSAIGCAGEYVVQLERGASLVAPTEITLEYGQTLPDPLHILQWSSLSWQRVENGVAHAKVVLARDVFGRVCCNYPLRGWDQHVGFYRDGVRVFGGPLVGWRRLPDGNIELAVNCLLAHAKKAYISDNRTFTATGVQQIISDLCSDIQDALSQVAPWYNINPSTVDPDAFAIYSGFIPQDRTYAIAEMKTLYDVIAELASETGVSFSCGGLAVHYGLYEFDLGMARPSLDYSSTIGEPQITVDCLDVAEDVFIVSAAAGAGGYQSVVNAAIVGLPPYASDFILQTHAQPDSRLSSESLVVAGMSAAAAALAPKVTIEQITLTPEFGSIDGYDNPGYSFVDPGMDGINDLMPGLIARWGYDGDCLNDIPVIIAFDPTDEITPLFYDFESFKHVRLVQVDVEVSKTDEGLSEVIRGSFTPWEGTTMGGWDA
jgi:hypothetical protein